MYTVRNGIEGLLSLFTGFIRFRLATGLPASGPYVGGQIYESAADALTAFATGGQANALQLLAGVNRITTVATAADSVKLQLAAPGASITVINAAAANSMNVYPATGDQINVLGVNAAFALPANKTATFYSTVAGQWHSQLTA